MVNMAYGVTTFHNPSIETISVFSDAELVLAGKKRGPRIFATGTIRYHQSRKRERNKERNQSFVIGSIDWYFVVDSIYFYDKGYPIYGAGGPYHCDIGSLDDALSALRRIQAYGGWSAKSYNQVRAILFQYILPL